MSQLFSKKNESIRFSLGLNKPAVTVQVLVQYPVQRAGCNGQTGTKAIVMGLSVTVIDFLKRRYLFAA